MAKICTSIEQSKKLIELGLDVNTADMYYISKPDKTNSNMIPSDIFIPKRKNEDGEAEGEILAWSLSALLELLPQHIDSRLGWQKFGLDKGWDGGIYQVYYENKNSFIEKKSQIAVDAAFEMVCWLLEHGFIKKG